MELSWIGYAVIAVIVVVNLLMLLRPVPPLNQPLSSKRVSFITDAPADAAFAAATAGLDGRARLVTADPGLRRALFADGMSFASWGFYYLAEFNPLPNDGTEVTISIRSKGFQVGPLVTRALRKLADEVESAIRRRAVA